MAIRDDLNTKATVEDIFEVLEDLAGYGLILTDDELVEDRLIELGYDRR